MNIDGCCLVSCFVCIVDSQHLRNSAVIEILDSDSRSSACFRSCKRASPGVRQMAISHLNFNSNTGGGTPAILFSWLLIRFGHSKISLPRLRLLTFKLPNVRPGVLIRGFPVEKLSFSLMFWWCFFVVSVLRPSRRVIYVRMPTSSVGICELGAVWGLVNSSRVSHLRLRLPSPVQSSPFLLSLVPRVCLPCCA